LKRGYLELLVFTLSSLLIAFVVGYLLYYEFAPESKDPHIEIVKVSQAESSRPDQRALTFVARNSGEVSVASAMIEFSAQLPDGKEVTRTVTFAFLPKGSERKGRVQLPLDVVESTIKYTVVSFILP